MIAPVGSTGLPTADETSFCNTEEIMRKIVPTSMKIDERARLLIEKCVTEFAYSVTNIAAGYCCVDQPMVNPIVAIVNKSAEVSVELKSDHIIRSLENMGYSEYSKPLSTFKQVQKAKTVLQAAKTMHVVEANQAKKQKLASGAAAPSVVSVPRMTMPVPPVPPAVNGKVVIARSNPVSAYALKQQHQEAVDQYLRNGSPAITIAEIARKLGASHGFVSKRAQALRDAKVELKGLKVSHQVMNNSRVSSSSGAGAVASVVNMSAVAALKATASAAIVSAANQAATPTQAALVTAPMVSAPQPTVPAGPTVQQIPQITTNVPV